MQKRVRAEHDENESEQDAGNEGSDFHISVIFSQVATLLQRKISARQEVLKFVESTVPAAGMIVACLFAGQSLVSETEFGALRVIAKLDRDEAVDLFPVRIVILSPGIDKFFAGMNFAVFAEGGHLLAVGRAQFPPPFPADPRVAFPRETLDFFRA